MLGIWRICITTDVSHAVVLMMNPTREAQRKDEKTSTRVWARKQYDSAVDRSASGACHHSSDYKFSMIPTVAGHSVHILRKSLRVS